MFKPIKETRTTFIGYPCRVYT